MAPVLTAPDRRREHRVAPWRFGVLPVAVMRPGLDVAVIDISAGGALVESAGPVRPGVRTDLALESADGPRCVRRVEVLRCWVHRLEPLAFRSAVQVLGRGEGRG